jgi:hypothetical protein
MSLDVRTFVSKEVFAQYGEKSWQFVSDNIVKLYKFTDQFFNDFYKSKDLTIEKVVIVVNDYHTKMLGGTFNNRGLRTVKYINDQIASGKKTAMLSQHVGGSTNAQDINVVIFYKGGRTRVVPSNEVYDTIVANEKVFMAAGLTTLENKTMTNGWTHMDCRFTGLDKLYIVNP